MGEYVSWIQLAVTGALLGIILRFVMAQRTEIEKWILDSRSDFEKEFKYMEKQAEEAKIEREKIKKDYLTEREHSLLCDNSTMKVNKHTSEEIKKWGDAIFQAIREIDAKIDRINNRTRHLKGTDG